MSDSPVDFSGDFYPIERVLLVGPLADIRGLAELARGAGHKVTLMPPAEELEQADDSFPVLSERDTVAENDFDLVLEAHCTNLEAKAEALLYLEDALGEDVPIITLALAITVGELSREMLMPERVVGFSMLPPFAEARSVELMVTPHTSEDALKVAEKFFESIRFDPAMRARVSDSPGGVLARTVCCLVNEAASAVQERIATADEIDAAMKLGVNYPYGPLAWGDRIGLDLVLAVMDGLYAEFKEDRYRPSPLLKRLVRAGFLGVKAGRGFFQY